MDWNQHIKDFVKIGLDNHLTHFEIAELWASPTHYRDDIRQYEERISQAVKDGALKAEISIRNPAALGGFEVIEYSPTKLRQIKDGWLGDTFVQFTISRDDFMEWLMQSKEWPLSDSCLLNYWFKTETVANVGAVGKWIKPDDEREFNLKLDALRRWMTSKGLEQNDSRPVLLKHYPDLNYTKETIYAELAKFDNAFLIAESTFNDFWKEQKLLKFK
jgi:hypothetical protein